MHHHQRQSAFSLSITAISTVRNKMTTMNESLIVCRDSIQPIEIRKDNSIRITAGENLKSYKKLVIDFNSQHKACVHSCIIFWKEYHNDFPILAQLARTYLCQWHGIPSESALSASAYISRKQRAHLNANYLSFGVFLKDKIRTE